METTAVAVEFNVCELLTSDEGAFDLVQHSLLCTCGARRCINESGEIRELNPSFIPAVTLFFFPPTIEVKFINFCHFPALFSSIYSHDTVKI